MLKNFVEYFIPLKADKSTEYQRRVRLIAYAIFVTLAFAFFYVVASWIAGYYAGLFIMLASWLCYLILLVMLKNGLNIFKVANIFGVIGALSIYGSIYFSGGFASPVLPWLASTPIVLLLIAGKKSGFVWAGVTVIIVLVFGLMDSYGYQFPKLYDPSKETYFALSCQSGLVLIIFFISIVFENIRVRAFNQVNEQKNTLENTLIELKTTQSQLIQSEKMASLGELTAGIAHEIQNPLNFVNNFSEISNELIDEMKEELAIGTEASVQLANEIADDVKQNLEKINHHGKRAEAIVNGMLEHSRTSTGQKELTDINKLADEYLRLTYHGLRAKDESFNADFKTELDETLPKINVIPQDIGRVLLNLINNAFYAVTGPPPSRNEFGTGPEGGFKDPEYVHKPTVIVKTSYLPPSGGMRGAGTGWAVLISVSDNGPGIPSHIVDKIFQPFFTTKPTGQGTGLGLSLSYDIIKAHGGELKVETIEGEGTEFIIQIPTN